MPPDASECSGLDCASIDDPSAGAILQLEPGFSYQLRLSDGQTCLFDLSRAPQIWVRPPPPLVERFRTSRHDWMLVIDEHVTLRRGQPTTVRVFEEAGSTWTYTSAPPVRIVASSGAPSPVTLTWD